MVFTPRLPTFNTIVTPFLYNPGSQDWTQGSTFEAQPYYAHRGQPGTQLGGVLFLSYAKEDNVLRDPCVFDLNVFEKFPPPADVVSFEFPSDSGVQHYYWVMTVNPRWLNFPNEHLSAYLKQMTLVEQAAVLGGGDGSILATLDWSGASNGDCDSCDTLALSFNLTEPTMLGSQTEPFDWSCTTSGQAIWTWGNAPAFGIAFAYLQDPEGYTYAAYQADSSGWDGNSPITLNLYDETFPDECDLGGWVIVTPA